MRDAEDRPWSFGSFKHLLKKKPTRISRPLPSMRRVDHRDDLIRHVRFERVHRACRQGKARGLIAVEIDSVARHRDARMWARDVDAKVVLARGRHVNLCCAGARDEVVHGAPARNVNDRCLARRRERYHVDR